MVVLTEFQFKGYRTDVPLLLQKVMPPLRRPSRECWATAPSTKITAALNDKHIEQHECSRTWQCRYKF
jgi:hypothetical protein